MRKIAWGIILLMFMASMLFSACGKKPQKPVDLKQAPGAAGGAPEKATK